MPFPTRAVIDIGTNSVKLLVGSVEGRNVHPLLEKSEQTRLGQGFYESRRLQPQPIQDTAEAVAAFVREAKSTFDLSSIRIVATSAARDALNQQELLDAIQTASGHSVEVISGEEEADWVFEGVTSDPSFATDPLLVLDVGGGSTEFIAGQGTKKFYRNSFNIGTVRLLEKLSVEDPPTADDWDKCSNLTNSFFRDQIVPALSPYIRSGFRLVGTGGSATILARIKYSLRSFERDKIEGAVLSRCELYEIQERLWMLPLEERKRIVGLPSKRADVILTGVAIYIAVMEHLQFDLVNISTRGLRYAALLQTANEAIP
ncbi:MAG: putative Ppx/GppA phosphatase [Verrucomicrobiales bacterium]|nr:putative Ppx/GppA phosphatase [Verrucomicrobiales bacterium]